MYQLDARLRKAALAREAHLLLASVWRVAASLRCRGNQNNVSLMRARVCAQMCGIWARCLRAAETRNPPDGCPAFSAVCLLDPMDIMACTCAVGLHSDSPVNEIKRSLD